MLLGLSAVLAWEVNWLRDNYVDPRRAAMPILACYLLDDDGDDLCHAYARFHLSANGVVTNYDDLQFRAFDRSIPAEGALEVRRVDNVLVCRGHFAADTVTDPHERFRIQAGTLAARVMA